jgi:hypothetical protein
MDRTFTETRDIVVRDEADVVIVGGGPGGVVAAIAAARHGMNVLIVEKQIILGGLSTGGHVCLFEPLCDGKGRQVVRGIVEEMLYASIAYSYNTLPSHWNRGVRYVEDPENRPGLESHFYMPEKGRYCTVFNVPAFTLALEEAALKENVRILYDTLFCEPVMEGDFCRGIIVENLSGRYAIACKILIDGTGFSTAFVKAGAPYQNYGNRFTVECYDTDFSLMRRAIQSGDIGKAINWRVIGWNPVLSDPNAAHLHRGETAKDVNDYVLLSHKALLDLLKQNQRPDYAMLALPTMPQLRMNRRIKGFVEMKTGDMHKPMEDSVGCVSDWRKSGPVYEIPYHCMLTPGMRNMAAVGRNISADDDLWDLMRCYPGAMATGQAAGTAAALAVKGKTCLHDVSVPKLQQALYDDGVLVHQTEFKVR